MPCGHYDGIIGGVGIGQAPDDADVGVDAKDPRQKVKADTGQEKEAGGLFQVKSENIVKNAR